MKTLEASSLRLKEFIRDGDSVIWGQACGEPDALIQALVEQRASLGTVRVFLGLGFTTRLAPEHADHLRFTSLTASGTRRALFKAGVLDLLPTAVSRLEPLIADGALSCDVVMVQVSPPNERGEYSLGLIGDYIKEAVGKARVVIAEINSNVPWVPCPHFLVASDIDIAIETDSPLAQLPAGKLGTHEKEIANHAQQYVLDRAVLQVGVGGVSDALLSMVRDRRDLGIHSGVIGDGVAELMQLGVITNAHKEIDAGLTVTGALMGTDRLYGFCHENDSIRMMPSSHTHNPAVVAQLSNFISINSALEVDLTGQVNAEAIAGDYFGGVGGHADYVRAAGLSAGGRSIIALSSTARGGASSRIVASLSGPVTTSRSDVDLIVTEYGAAELRGKSLGERIYAMIAIADPAHREDLSRRAHEILKGWR